MELISSSIKTDPLNKLSNKKTMKFLKNDNYLTFQFPIADNKINDFCG